MTRADNDQTRVHYKGSDEDFVIICDGSDMVRKWKEDKSTPLVQVVQSFDVFVTHKHGAQGKLDRASKAVLENEFGSSKDEDVVQQILEKGQLQEYQAKGKQGDTNTQNGPQGGGMGVHN